MNSLIHRLQFELHRTNSFYYWKNQVRKSHCLESILYGTIEILKIANYTHLVIPFKGFINPLEWKYDENRITTFKLRDRKIYTINLEANFERAYTKVTKCH